MNRWDATANEPEFVESVIENFVIHFSEVFIQVRQQHLDRGLEFLCDELHLYDRKEALEHRMFFISAREALLSRNTDPKSSFNEGLKDKFLIKKNRIEFYLGYKERLVEFNKFEHEFEKCISKSAVQTKFEQHTNRGKEILCLLCETMTNIINKSQTLKQEYHEKLNQLEEKNSFLESELRLMTSLAKDRIQYVSEDVYKRVAQTLNDEIKR
jgi:mitofusin